MLNSSLTLEEYAVQEVKSLNGNESSLKKIISLIKKLKRQNAKAADDSVMTPEAKQRILDDIKAGYLEAKLAEAGKVELQSWEDFKRELHS